jgi:hypothetical protein
MSNELTPQEQYPKFYKDPHLWIGAIEVECVKSFMRPVGMGVSGYNEGEIIKLTPQNYDWLKSPRIIECVKPIFNPQEGDQFIKDLESAVSAGVGTQARRIIKSPKNIIAFDAEDKFHQVIMIVENDIKRVTSMLTDFDTVAYVTTLLKLGYYL